MVDESAAALSAEPDPGTARYVEPDPSLVSAIGTAHDLESAIADIVDNSIDADARNILVQFITDDSAVVGLFIVDDGQGMDKSTIDSAMTYGRRRDYKPGALGHFGVGLKAASMSQADELAVFSRRVGYTPQGRQMHRSGVDAGAPRVLSFSTAQVNALFDRIQAPFPLENGTVVRWSQPRTFTRSDNFQDAQMWLGTTRTALGKHLSTVFHRGLQRGDFQIFIGEYDRGLDMAGMPMELEGLDPFDYSRTGHPRFPVELHGSADGVDFTFTLHMWPASGVKDPQFLLGTRDGVSRQGIYVYRSDRLLQAGGWHGLYDEQEERKLLRARLELTGELLPFVQIDPEKSNVEFKAPMVRALKTARSVDGLVDLAGALELAKSAFKESKKRKRNTGVEPLREPTGISPAVRDVIADRFGFDGEPPIDFTWAKLHPHKVFEFDLHSRRLLLNSALHEEITGVSGPASSGQAPFVVTLIYLLMRDDFKRLTAGDDWKRRQNEMQRVLYAALKADGEWRRKVAEQMARREARRAGGE